MRYAQFLVITLITVSLTACGGGTIDTNSKGSSSGSAGSSTSGGSSSTSNSAGGQSGSTSTSTGSTTSSGTTSSGTTSSGTTSSGTTSSGTTSSGTTSSGTTSGSTTSGGTSTDNVAPLVVDSGPAGLTYHDVDVPFTTITLCDDAIPANCQTIDHILVDTGSTGLRIMASVLSPALKLSNASDANGRNIGECTMFVSGYIWGPVKMANLTIAGETTGSMPVQVVGDSSFAPVPTACSNAGGGLPMNTVDAFGANGLIGVGSFKHDCGQGCASNANNGIYYGCTNSSCSSISLSVQQQLPNPVSLFAVDNNGVIISLPAVSKTGAASVSGSLIFGINTQTNNHLNGATILTLDPTTGFMPTTFNSTTLCDSFIDSGSNGMYFPVSGSLASSLPFCASGSSFYCPSSTQDFSAVIGGINGAQSAVNFSIANLNQLSSSYTAFNDVAGGNTYGGYSYTGCSGSTGGFDWGLPFFFGRNVYVAFEGENVGGSTGPFDAF